jgi:hypothetical protein
MRQAADLSRRADPARAPMCTPGWARAAADEDERGFLTAYEAAERLSQHTGHGGAVGTLRAA